MKRIAQNLFKSLWYCPVEGKYYVLNDLNYEDSFYANSDEEAIQRLGWKEGEYVVYNFAS